MLIAHIGFDLSGLSLGTNSAFLDASKPLKRSSAFECNKAYTPLAFVTN
jgi:hypothetical protein